MNTTNSLIRDDALDVFDQNFQNRFGSDVSACKCTNGGCSRDSYASYIGVVRELVGFARDSYQQEKMDGHENYRRVLPPVLRLEKLLHVLRAPCGCERSPRLGGSVSFSSTIDGGVVRGTPTDGDRTSDCERPQVGIGQTIATQAVEEVGGLGETESMAVLLENDATAGRNEQTAGDDTVNAENRGRWYWHNKRKKQLKRDKRKAIQLVLREGREDEQIEELLKQEKQDIEAKSAANHKKSSIVKEIPVWRRKTFPESEPLRHRKSEVKVVSGSRKSVLDARLSETLTERRIAENELNAALARKKLREVLESEEVRPSQDLPKQERVEQWVNPTGSWDSGSHAQGSSPIDRCATLPSSSADLPSAGTDRISVDSGEIRTLIKAKSDVDFELECALKYIKEVEPLVEKKFVVPACAATEEANEGLYLATGYVRPQGDIQKMLRSCSQECNIRDVPHAERFDFRLKQIIERNRLNIDCGF